MLHERRQSGNPANPSLVHAENLNPDVTVMKSAKGGMRFDASGRLSGLRLPKIKPSYPTLHGCKS
jgi:hypothetical protein